MPPSLPYSTITPNLAHVALLMRLSGIAATVPFISNLVLGVDILASLLGRPWPFTW